MARGDVLDRLSEGDVFMLPTRAEGLPAALVEAMGAGLVPIVSDIRSGIPEIVQDGVTGLLARVDDVEGFAGAIERLQDSRDCLEKMSRAVRASVATRFDPASRTAAYQALFARWRELRRPRASHLPMPYCTRLDRPWLPNPVVRTVRAAIRRYQGKPA
jgi:glycosyltransferase involved in cell wall biosynthesis